MVHRLPGRCVAVLAMALVVGSLLPSSARAADPGKTGTALDLVPADAAFCSAALHNKEQLDALLNSKAYAKFRDLPAVKEAIEKFQAEWKKEDGELAAVRKFLEQPENKDLLALLGDAVGTEIFVYGGDGWTNLMELYLLYNRSSYNALLDMLAGKTKVDGNPFYYTLKAFNDHTDMIRVPELTIGFKVSDPKKAEAQIARLEMLAALLAMKEPKFKDAVKRQKVAGADFLTLTIDSASFDWPKDPFKDIEREKGEFAALEKKLKGLKVVVGLGVKDGYLLLTIGPSVEHVAKLGGAGPKLASVKELAPLGKYVDRKLTSIHYVSKKFNALAQRVGASMLFAPLGDPDALAEFGTKAIDRAKVPDAKKTQMRQDLAELVKDMKKAIPEAGAVAAFEFLTPRGYEGFLYDYGQHPYVDGSKPLTLLDHVGGNPIFFAIGRSKGAAGSWDLLVKWARTGYGYLDEYVQANVKGADLDKYNAVMKELLPLAKRFDEVTRTKWLPALADGQSALVLDAKWSSKHWYKDAPTTDRALPLPEVGVVFGVSDPDLLKDAVKDYRDILNALLALAADKSPEGTKIPPITIPVAQSEKVTAGTLYFYPIPKEVGLDPQVLPAVGLGKDVGAFALSKEHAARLLTATPFKADGGPLAGPRKPLTGAVYYNNAALMDALAPWADVAVDAAMKKNDPNVKEKDIEDMRKQVRTLLEIAKCFRGYSSATYLENGVLVTHHEMVFKDLDK